MRGALVLTQKSSRWAIRTRRDLNTLTSGEDLTKSKDEVQRGSAVLFLHLGEPNSNEELSLQSRLSALYGLDRWKFLRHAIEFFPHFQLTRRRLAQNNGPFDRHSEKFRQTIESQQLQLQPILNQLLPELAPFRCSSAFAFAKPTIEDAIAQLRQNPVDRVFLLPLYPQFWCFQSGTCANRIAATLRLTSVPSDRDESLRSSTGTAEQFQPAAPTRWSLIDRWPAHPALTDAYAKLIAKELRYFPYDVESEVAILFCAPIRTGYDALEYQNEISSSCLRIAEAVGGHPYKVSWFRPWDSMWKSFSRWNGLLSGVKEFIKQKRPNILVVPLSYVASSYDTDVIVPNLLTESALKRVGAHHIRILPPPNNSPVFIQGLAELLKNHHLSGAKCSPQYSLKCHNCSNRLCQQSRRIFKC